MKSYCLLILMVYHFSGVLKCIVNIFKLFLQAMLPTVSTSRQLKQVEMVAVEIITEGHRYSAEESNWNIN